MATYRGRVIGNVRPDRDQTPTDPSTAAGPLDFVLVRWTDPAFEASPPVESPPVVSTYSPIDGSTGVSVSVAIQVTILDNSDTSPIDLSTIEVTIQIGADPPEVVYTAEAFEPGWQGGSYTSGDSGEFSLNILPDSPFPNLTVIIVQVSAMDTSSNSLSPDDPFEFSFLTEEAEPEVGEVCDVDVNRRSTTYPLLRRSPTDDPCLEQHAGYDSNLNRTRKVYPYRRTPKKIV